MTQGSFGTTCCGAAIQRFLQIFFMIRKPSIHAVSYYRPLILSDFGPTHLLSLSVPREAALLLTQVLRGAQIRFSRRALIR